MVTRCHEPGETGNHETGETDGPEPGGGGRHVPGGDGRHVPGEGGHHVAEGDGRDVPGELAVMNLEEMTIQGWYLSRDAERYDLRISTDGVGPSSRCRTKSTVIDNETMQDHKVCLNFYISCLSRAMASFILSEKGSPLGGEALETSWVSPRYRDSIQANSSQSKAD